jgi:hypothetical protein
VYNVSSNTWTTATLSQARSDLTSTSVANRFALFAGGYIGSGPSNVVDIFDYLNGKWSTSTLSQPRGGLTSTSLRELAFFAGGYNGSRWYTTVKTSNIVDIFNSITQTWSVATLSQNRTLLASASIGEIVAFGGGTPDGLSASSIVDVYNITSNIWFTTTLSEARAFLASTSTRNKIFFGGGLSNTGLSDIVDIFDFSSPPPPQSITSSETNDTNSSTSK